MASGRFIGIPLKTIVIIQVVMIGSLEGATPQVKHRKKRVVYVSFGKRVSKKALDMKERARDI